MSFKDALEIFVPGADATPERLITWRFFMGMWATISIFAIICLYTITAKGSDVDELKAAVYIPAILQLHEKRCLITDATIVQELTISINQYQQKYKEIAGDLFPLEACEEIIRRNGGKEDA